MLFAYQGYTAAGADARGTVEAPDEREALRLLQARGVFARSLAAPRPPRPLRARFFPARTPRCAPRSGPKTGAMSPRCRRKSKNLKKKCRIRRFFTWRLWKKLFKMWKNRLSRTIRSSARP
ncbi:MAG: hypothetical protein II839_10380 [Kiritimatiellae bacterium]|nr:hypothetical protein [Kiritimatiellia bacterium]